MANNRLYLYCNNCKKAIVIAKTMGDGWYSVNADLNDFFDQHDRHNKEDGFGTNFYKLIEENDKKVKQVGFKDKYGDCDLGLTL